MNATVEKEIMGQLQRHPERWYRPMDLGAWDSSPHSRILAKLCKQGKVECRRRCVSIVAALGSKRAGKEYKLALPASGKDGAKGGEGV